MKNLMIAAVAVCTLFLGSCQTAKNPKNFTTLDSLSYAAGVQFGTSFRAQDSTLNGAVMGAALRDAFEGKTIMTLEEANAFIQEWFTVRKPAEDQAKNQAWFDEVKAENPNVQTTESGILYEIIAQGDPAVKAVNDADQVMVNYRGTLQDGFEFDKNDSITFPLNRVISGWTEGMKLVGKGGEVVLWIPSEMAYGPQPRQGIPANSALKFEVKLLDVIPAPVAE
jgi:FKBP-type peptidyl-prolyl cis-trans isomerase